MYSIVDCFLIIYRILNASIYVSIRYEPLRLFKFQCLWSRVQLVFLLRYNFLLFPLNFLITSSIMLIWHILNEYVTGNSLTESSRRGHISRFFIAQRRLPSLAEILQVLFQLVLRNQRHDVFRTYNSPKQSNIKLTSYLFQCTRMHQWRF
jgi:hypothetical protein